ncbi:MAG: DUF456 domain-containing protein [Balneolaceae bacterium]|nr:DUF456 domain-containing protein [Balneolaceae bacterium]
MEYVVIIAGGLCILAGMVGSLLPVLPGPPISYLGLILLQFTTPPPFTLKFMLLWAAIVVAVMVLDNLIPAYGTKKFGGSPFGVGGSIAGLVAGLFFAPAGIILGPVIGAFLGELIAGKQSDKALKSALGSFLGFMAGTLLKLVACGMMGYYFVMNI